MDRLTGNPHWKDQLSRIDLIGVRESQGLFNIIRNHEAIDISCAIAFLAALKRHKNIDNPELYFRHVLAERLARENAIAILKDRTLVEERKALFDFWLSCTTKLGNWNSYVDIDGSRWVGIDNGKPTDKFSDAWNRGWTIEYMADKIHLLEIFNLELTGDFTKIN
ncbi:hypothetical protein Xen7305DRAFT_00008340 [Xenococcus sp. PCC 7305]|uniref:hypothetical protein n=1 Tax=Xenococcus sp. PCC 7305 TaxID=102125 RepID=UPI0002AC1D8E|nr:hypothetical protein [Xenococcus sp. PCC 7305]ELS01132.1 hypothetical protein Xen7305DRAFT_00008340 [Xenococcus sp. PCC 7305]